MCRWGCTTTDTTYMCKWCGTRFCKACLRGEFGTGYMKESSWCFQCNQKKCIGKRVEYVPGTAKSTDNKKSGKSRKSSKTAKSSTSNKSKSKKSKKTKKKK